MSRSLNRFAFAPFTLPLIAPTASSTRVSADAAGYGRLRIAAGQPTGNAAAQSAPADRVIAIPRRPRIVLYSHDTCGLGHTRRNLLLAKALADPPLEADILLITGIREAREFGSPRGIDLVSLPALFKEEDGHYRARALGLEIEELLALRSRIILSSLEGFRPDLLIVDNAPRGAMGELDHPLSFVRKQLGTRLVLGLRDVLDDPRAVQREWKDNGLADVVRDCYDAVWIYGDPNVYDLSQECDFPPEIREKVTFTGYLEGKARLQAGHAHAARLYPLPPGFPGGRLHMCIVGGGQDGEFLAESFITSELPPDVTGLVLTGPFMPEEVQDRLAALASRRRLMYVVGFYAEPVILMEEAERVVSMGGYNSICELLSLEKEALIVPRIVPRQEQLIRARRLHELGLIDMLHPEEVTAQAVGEWLSRPSHARPPRPKVDMGALERVPMLAADLLGVAVRTPPRIPRSDAA